MQIDQRSYHAGMCDMRENIITLLKEMEAALSGAGIITVKIDILDIMAEAVQELPLLPYNKEGTTN